MFNVFLATNTSCHTIFIEHNLSNRKGNIIATFNTIKEAVNFCENHYTNQFMVVKNNKCNIFITEYCNADIHLNPKMYKILFVGTEQECKYFNN